jgi:SAM-dependent methyltransferase
MIDFGRTALDYATHRAGFPDLLFDRLATLDLQIDDAAVVDLGTGTGALARGFARRGAKAIGVDTARPMLEQARRLDAAEGLAIDYRLGRAEETGLPSGAFDIVAAGQCWHWFDRPRATTEAFRLLAQARHLVIAYLDWLPLPDSVVEATEKLILKHNPAWQMAGGSGVHPEYLADLSGGGFIGIQTFSFDLIIPYTHEAWRGRIRASAGVAASLVEDAVARFDHEHAAMLKSRFQIEPLQVPHRVWAAVATKSYIKCGHARLAST